MTKTALRAFVFPGVIWGGNFIFVKWAAQEISPVGFPVDARTRRA
jgi:hypothetical protein